MLEAAIEQENGKSTAKIFPEIARVSLLAGYLNNFENAEDLTPIRVIGD